MSERETRKTHVEQMDLYHTLLGPDEQEADVSAQAEPSQDPELAKTGTPAVAP